MKNYYVIFIFLVLGISDLQGQQVEPDSENFLKTHLIQVNPLWSLYPLEDKQIIFNSDKERIQRHFQEVVTVLKQKNVNHLLPEQIVARQSIITTLSNYGKTGSFPKNHHFNVRKTVFKDQEQTSCAVAHLLETSGQEKLVTNIQQRCNYSLIKDIVNEIDEVSSWAENTGLSLEELELIQPVYPSYPRNFYKWGQGGAVDGKINVMKTNRSKTLLYIAGDFKEIDGYPTNSIIAWNGEEWNYMGNGVNGEIHDMYISGSSVSSDSDIVYIVGDFYLNDDPTHTNIACYNDGEWVGLQQGDMEGSVYTINVENPYLLVGGDFLFINGQPISYLAQKKLSDTNWTNSIRKFINGEVQDVENAFSVDGPVTKIEVPSFDRIIVGGEFSITAPNADPSLMNQVEAPNLAFWQDGNWVEGPGGPYNKVLDISQQYGKLYISDEILQDGKLIPVVHTMCSGFWSTLEMKHINGTQPANNLVKFLHTEENVFTYGNLEFYDQDGQGFVWINYFNWDGEAGGIRFNNTVRAAATFQDKFYFAGDFTQVMSAGAGDFPVHESPGLIIADRQVGLTLSTQNEELQSYNVYCHDKVLHLELLNFHDQGMLVLYDYNGKLLKRYKLENVSTHNTYDLSDLAEGVYIYNIHYEKGMKSGKLSVF